MPNIYDVIDTPKLAAAFTDPDDGDAASDPACVLLKVWTNSGTVWTYTYGLSLQGTWDASTNTPTLADGTGTVGHYYTVSAAGSINFGNGAITFSTDDWVFYDGVRWRKAENVQSDTLTNDETGSYYYNLRVYEENVQYFYRFEGYNAATSTAAETHIRIRDSAFY